MRCWHYKATRIAWQVFIFFGRLFSFKGLVLLVQAFEKGFNLLEIFIYTFLLTLI